MPKVVFTQNLQRHVPLPSAEAEGATVRAVLDRVFDEHPRMRGYVLDDRGALRHHMAIFVDGQQVKDRDELSDPVPPDGEIHVIQALSGG